MSAGHLSDERILAGIAAVAHRHLNFQGPLFLKSRLLEDLELDSLKSLTLALEIENHFQVCLDEEGGIETVADLVAAIRKQLDE